jgi:NAD(P)-dependent dehydrogenase (short-subunit alcohol dehydrogenase family)
MKTIFITGASTGIGKAVAKLFAANGWKVIATMRKPQNETELNLINNITLLPLDITNLEQIKDTVQKAITLGNIDVVFNNAGYGLAGPMEGMSDKQITKQLDTNLLGTLRVTQTFIAHFREKQSGLFISTTSIGGLVTFPFFSIYHATKWALEGWSESMSFELNKFGIGIKTVSPGSTKTDFVSRSLDLAKHPDYDELLEKTFSVFANNPQTGTLSSSEHIASIVYEAATDGKDQIRYVAGDDAIYLYNERLKLGDEQFRKNIDEMFFGK